MISFAFDLNVMLSYASTIIIVARLRFQSVGREFYNIEYHTDLFALVFSLLPYSPSNVMDIQEFMMNLIRASFLFYISRSHVDFVNVYNSHLSLTNEE